MSLLPAALAAGAADASARSLRMSYPLLLLSTKSPQQRVGPSGHPTRTPGSDIERARQVRVNADGIVHRARTNAVLPMEHQHMYWVIQASQTDAVCGLL
jgi:hypothetical protein